MLYYCRCGWIMVLTWTYSSCMSMRLIRLSLSVYCAISSARRTKKTQISSKMCWTQKKLQNRDDAALTRNGKSIEIATINHQTPGADPWICERGRPLPFPCIISFYSLPFPVPPLLLALEGSGERWKLPQWGAGRTPPKTNLVHFKSVRKPLVAITLNILSTMFYSTTINI